MSGGNKSYLPSQRMMPTYTTVPNQLEDRDPSPEYAYDPEPSPEGNSGGPVMDSRQSPMAMSPYGGQNSRGTVSEQSLAAVAAYGRQAFPYGISGVAMPTYNYGSELYNYVSNGFPRKSRMCSYCNKIFTRSTTRRYHEKRCPLLRAAGSLMSASSSDLGSGKGLVLSSTSSAAATVSSVISSAYANSVPPGGSYADYHSQVHTSTSSAMASPAGDPSPNSYVGGGGKSDGRDFSDSSSNLSGSRQDPSRYPTDSKVVLPSMFSPLHEGSNGSPVGMVTENISDAGSLDNEDGLVKPSFVNGSDRSVRHQSGSDRQEQSPPFTGGVQPKLSPSNGSPTSLRVKKEIEDGVMEPGEVGGLYQKEMINNSPSQAPSKMQGPYPCRFCGEGFFKESSRAAHERVHAVDKTYLCVLCIDTFSSKSALRDHMISTHQRGPYLCKICKRSFPDAATIKAHLESHDLPKGEKDSALYIGYTGAGDPDSPDPDPEDEDSNTGSSIDTDEKEEVNGEMEIAQEPEENAEDSKAKSSAEPPANYEGVVNGSNSRDKMWCQICKQEISKSMWRFHERVHADEKPYECTICQKRFGYKNNMKSHMKLHAGIKPYQCNVCGAKFTRGSTLRRHSRRHGYRTDAVYDLYLHKPRLFKQPDHPPPLALASVQAVQNMRPSPDSDVVSSRSSALDAAKVVADSPLGYDLSRYTSHSPAAPYLAGAYPPSGALPQSMYPGLPSTTASLLQYGSSYAAAVVQAEQSDALNLSLNSKTSGHRHGTPSSLQDEDMGGMGNSPPQGRPVYRMGQGSDGRPTPRPSPPEPGLRQMHSPGRMTPHQEMGGVFQTPQTHGGLLGPQRSFGVQVNLCCGAKASIGSGGGGASSSAADLHMMSSPTGSEGSGSLAMSPGMSSSTADPRDMEPLMALVSAKKLFRCEHCECYFADYPMYRLHQKLHLGARPFQCPICMEDCHDRVYFTIHVNEHLR